MQIKCSFLAHKSCITFQIEFSKIYENDEDTMRFMLFRETLEQIKEHNIKFSKGQVDVEAGLNEYSDWTDVEKRKILK